MNGSARAVAASAVVAALAATAACSGSSNPNGRSHHSVVSGGTITLAVPVDPGNLDPQHSADNFAIARLAYDTPITIGADGKVLPGVVTSWKDVGGTRTWQLTVRKDVTCSDGSPLDAKTVAANINYVANPKNGSPFAGAAVALGAQATADATSSIVTVKTPSPTPFFVQSLQLLSLICSKGLADRKLLASASDGSGPYVISHDVPGEQVTYTLRKGYTWGPTGATTTSVSGIPAKVIVKTVTSYTTTANLLLSGQLNAAQVVGPDANRLKSARLYSDGGVQTNDDLIFNHAASSPASDESVRKALLMALDLNALSTVDGGGVGAKATGLLPDPKICPGNLVSGNLPDFDLGQAKTLLDSAGWIAGPDGNRSKAGKQLAITLLYATGRPATSAAAEFIAAQWKKLGVHVSLAQKSSDQMLADLFGGRADFGAVLQAINVSTPAQLVPLLSGPTPPHGQNVASITNQQYLADVGKAQQLAGTAGCSDWNAAESALYKSADLVPLATTPNVWWGKDADFTVDNLGVIIPTTMRRLAG